MSKIDPEQWIVEQVAAVPLLVHRDGRARGMCLHNLANFTDPKRSRWSARLTVHPFPRASGRAG